MHVHSRSRMVMDVNAGAVLPVPAGSPIVTPDSYIKNSNLTFSAVVRTGAANSISSFGTSLVPGRYLAQHCYFERRASPTTMANAYLCSLGAAPRRRSGLSQSRHAPLSALPICCRLQPSQISRLHELRLRHGMPAVHGSPAPPRRTSARVTISRL